MDTVAVPLTPFRDRFAFRVGFFRKARRIWNCLAWHWAVDEAKRTLRMTFAIPGILTAVVETPLPLPTRLAVLMAGGEGETAGYGLWHDYYETKLQWRYVVGLPRVGYEWRRVHDRPHCQVFVQDTVLTGLVGDVGAAWAERNKVERWELRMVTQHEEVRYSLIPDLYDHHFVLRAVTVDDTGETTHEATLRADMSPKIKLMDTFITLTEQIDLTQPAIPPAPAAV